MDDKSEVQFESNTVSSHQEAVSDFVVPTERTDESSLLGAPEESQALTSLVSPNDKLEQTKIGDELAQLMEVLKNTDENNKLAKLNETTISDNNGGRIEL